jgi:hypothetical protein
MQVYGVADMSAQVEIDFFKNCYQKKKFICRCKVTDVKMQVEINLFKAPTVSKVFQNFLWAAGRR